MRKRDGKEVIGKNNKKIKVLKATDHRLYASFKGLLFSLQRLGRKSCLARRRYYNTMLSNREEAQSLHRSIRRTVRTNGKKELRLNPKKCAPPVPGYCSISCHVHVMNICLPSQFIDLLLTARSLSFLPPVICLTSWPPGLHCGWG